MDTLEYMRKGGRVSLPQAVIAGWLNVKPITIVNEGKIEPIARTRSKPKAIEKLLELMAERVTETGPLHVGVVHGDFPDEAAQLAQRISDRYQVAEMVSSEITPVIGTHLGPGTIGIGFYNE